MITTYKTDHILCTLLKSFEFTATDISATLIGMKAIETPEPEKISIKAVKGKLQTRSLIPLATYSGHFSKEKRQVISVTFNFRKGGVKVSGNCTLTNLRLIS